MELTTMERKHNKLDTSKIENNDLMALVYWVKVKKAASGELLVTDLDNSGDIVVRGKELIENSFSSDRYSEELKVSKTQAAEILIHSANRPFTVSFDKQNGEERVLRGRLVRPESLLGRSMVEDLDIDDPKDRVRQVDHRTLNYLIVDGVKYTVK